MELQGKICWLAFCSGSFLKRNGRQIPLPSDLWKETTLAYSGWSDQTAVFEDGLGLPRSINIFATNNQTIFQYQTRQSTNVLGWNFPSEFYLVQYSPEGTNGWKLHLTAKGKVTAISKVSKSYVELDGTSKTPASPTVGPADKARQHYVVTAGGLHSFVGITNTPESNPVRVFFKRWGGDDPSNQRIAVFGLTNAESQAILLWNVRVQVRSKGQGTDGLGWDSVSDDYPTATLAYSSAHYPPAASGEFWVERPRDPLWRVCILYSKQEAGSDRAGSGRRYVGNYEAISQELKE